MAFLPQFIDPGKPLLAQYALLALLTALLDVVVMVCYALGGYQAARLLSARGLQCLNRGCAVVLLALAGYLACYRRASN